MLLTTRVNDVAAAEEYESFLKMSGLTPGELRWVRLEAEPLPPLEFADHSGFLLGGSQFNVSDPDEVKSPLQLRVETELGVLLRRVLEVDHPVLGICYGIGTIGRLIGATVDRRYSEITNEVTISLTPEGVADPLCAGLESSFGAFVGHKEAIGELPDSATVLATGEGCPVQMFRYGANVYATQFHPEMDGPAFARRIDLYRDAGYFPPPEAERLIAAAASSTANCGAVIGNFVRRYGG
ncbi:glutamine amidotransferase [Naumannella halotolerans]|uniref:glutamine amidotransferase n=1 Tax=Naumannella halotolerans TaxID=993414 RepID=UPI00370D1FCA